LLTSGGAYTPKNCSLRSHFFGEPCLRAADQAHTPTEPTNHRRGGRAFALTRLQIARSPRAYFYGFLSVFQFTVFARAKTLGDIAPSFVPSRYTLKSSYRIYFLSSYSRSGVTISASSTSV